MPIRTKKRIRDGVIVNSDETTAVAVHPDNLPEEFFPDDRDLKLLLDKAITADDWHNVFRKALEMALEGNIKAMEFIAKYRFGLPSMMVHHEGSQTQINIVEVVRTQGSPKTELRDQALPEKPAGAVEGEFLDDKFDAEAEEKPEPSVPF